MSTDHAGIVAYDLPLPARRPAWGAPVFPPGLGLFPSSPDGPYFAPFREGGATRPRAAKCYRLASGAMVHVKPECRC